MLCDQIIVIHRPSSNRNEFIEAIIIKSNILLSVYKFIASGARAKITTHIYTEELILSSVEH